MDDAFLGTIMLWPLDWAPQGWLMCDGRLLPIAQNQALYSLLGTKYGGDGTSTFALPDLRGRVPVGYGLLDGNQSLPYPLAKKLGQTTAATNAMGTGSITLTEDNLPSHTHTATFNSSGGSSKVSIAIPVIANPSAGSRQLVPGPSVSLTQAATEAGDTVTAYSSDATGSTLKPFDVAVPAGGGTVTNANTGGGKAVPVQVGVPVQVSTAQPSLTLNFIICTQGLYPMRPY